MLACRQGVQNINDFQSETKRYCDQLVRTGTQLQAILLGEHLEIPVKNTERATRYLYIYEKEYRAHVSLKVPLAGVGEMAMAR